MASLTGLAFQIDFLVGRGSRKNAVNQIRDTVDEVNLIARQGAQKASGQRRKKLEQDLKALDKLSEQSAKNLVKGREAAAKEVAGKVGAAASKISKKAAADTSGLDKVGKKVKSVTMQMKAAFKSLNTDMASRGMDKLAGKGFADKKTLVDLASREKDERDQILAIMQNTYNLDKAAGEETKGQQVALQAMKDLLKEIDALEKGDLKTRRELGQLATKYVKEFDKAEKQEIKHLRETIHLRQQAGDQIDRMAESVGSTLRNSFVYSTAAVVAFYYKLNDVLTTFRDFEKEMINAQSIFQTTNETLFSLSDQIAHFGLEYGIELQNAATGLYQLASAGLTAEESIKLLNNTLKLSMAVQGDHNTISKLTTQTIFGFGLSMDDSAEVTDKFAHAINKSLIEYQDLASAVKFAMPFFVATGQTLDQLLGSLQVLTNRALEAGIAGRGLRQALAEFAESAEDNTRAFRKMGIEIINSEGNFKQLTEIARDFHDTFGEAATDVELMTTLLEDLNVRGATAFIHLVQNVDEFEGAVNDLQNSAGSAHKMAMIQQQSLTNQIQILKNALMAPFLITDEIGLANGYLNEFHMTLHNMISTFSDLIYTTLPDGTHELTEMGTGIKVFVIEAFKQLTVLISQGMTIFKRLSGEVKSTMAMFNMILVPLKVVAKLMEILGPAGLQAVMMWRVMNGILPISTLMLNQHTVAQLNAVAVTKGATEADKARAGAMATVIGLRMVAFAGMGMMIWATMLEAEGNSESAKRWFILGGAIMGVAIAYQSLRAAGLGGPVAFAAAAAAGAYIGHKYHQMMQKMMEAPIMPEIQAFDLSGYEDQVAGVSMTPAPVADLGMTMPKTYDTGGRPNHRMVYVEPGETITSKTQNMLGGANGITINVEGDVWDEERFTERIAEALGGGVQRVQINRGMM